MCTFSMITGNLPPALKFSCAIEKDSHHYWSQAILRLEGGYTQRVAISDKCLCLQWLSKKLVDRTINNLWQIELKQQKEASLYDNTQGPEENAGYFDFSNVLYIAGFTERLSKDMYKFE